MHRLPCFILTSETSMDEKDGMQATAIFWKLQGGSPWRKQLSKL